MMARALSNVAYFGILVLVSGAELQAQELSNDKGTGLLSTGIFKLEDFNVKVFEVPDAERPRIGTVIYLTEADESEGKDNFRFCDETTARVKLDSLVESGRSCEQPETGSPIDVSIFMKGGTVAVYSGEKILSAKIVSISPSPTGGFVGMMEFPNEVAAAKLAEVQFTQGKVAFSRDAMANYTAADRLELYSQWESYAQGEGVVSSTVMDFGSAFAVKIGSGINDNPVTGGDLTAGVKFNFDIAE
jgi:hypothetical protein